MELDRSLIGLLFIVFFYLVLAISVAAGVGSWLDHLHDWDADLRFVLVLISKLK